jgi:hypothetical protein
MVACNYNEQKDDFAYEIKFKCRGTPDQTKQIWELLDVDNRLTDKYFNGFFINWAKKDMIKSKRSFQEYKLNTGKLYFFETQLYDERDNHYVAEPLQIIWLLSPSKRKCITTTRRGTKTTTCCQADPLWEAVFRPAFPTVVITQGWETARTHLVIPQMWCDKNRQIEKWAGGRGATWKKTEMWFKNRSYIQAFTGGSTEKLRGKIPAPKKIVRDELAFHEGDNPETVILSMGTIGEGGADTVTSTPVAGENAFARVQVDMSYDHYFHPLYCPKGYESYYCDEDCPYFSWHGLDIQTVKELPLPECRVPVKYDDNGFPLLDDVFWRLPENRLSRHEVLEKFEEIGMMRFEQEFLLRPHSLEGNIFSKAYLDKFVFDTELPVLEEYWQGPVFLGIDYGLTKASRTVIAVGKRHATVNEENDDVFKCQLINLIVFPVGTPYSKVAKYIANEVFDSYQVDTIVADANTPTKDHVENELMPLLEQRHGFNKVVAYHTLGHGSKEFMAKAEMLDFVKGKFELGERLRFFKDQDLYAEMLSLRGKETAAGNLQIESDTTTDRFMACMYMAWGALANVGGGYIRIECGLSPMTNWGEEVVDDE